MYSTVRVENVPRATVKVICKELVNYGCRVGMDTELSGKVWHDAGVVSFDHDGIGVLVVVVEVDAGHFPGSLLIGGIKQMIEEASEDVRKQLATKV